MRVRFGNLVNAESLKQVWLILRIIPVLLPAVIGFLQAGYGDSVTGEVYLQKAEIALENNCTIKSF